MFNLFPLERPNDENQEFAVVVGLLLCDPALSTVSGGVVSGLGRDEGAEAVGDSV